MNESIETHPGHPLLIGASLLLAGALFLLLLHISGIPRLIRLRKM